MESSLPFKINISTEVMRWRAETFWAKEPETILWLRNHCESINPVSFFLDVGANIGMYSLFAASLSQSVFIVAVEPAPNNSRYLSENIQLNNFSNRFILVSQPLASKVFRGSLANPDQRPGATGAQVHKESTLGEHQITTITGDFLVEQSAIYDGILKIDVDGNELDILIGFEKSLKEKRFRSILVELTESNINQITLFMRECEYVEDLSYRSLPEHSDSRRRASGKSESNTIFIIQSQNT